MVVKIGNVERIVSDSDGQKILKSDKDAIEVKEKPCRKSAKKETAAEGCANDKSGEA